MSDDMPYIGPEPAPGEMVQVLMTREMAQRFEDRCLGANTRGGTAKLAGPLVFSDDDLPTYVISA